MQILESLRSSTGGNEAGQSREEREDFEEWVQRQGQTRLEMTDIVELLNRCSLRIAIQVLACACMHALHRGELFFIACPTLVDVVGQASSARRLGEDHEARLGAIGPNIPGSREGARRDARSPTAS